MLLRVYNDDSPLVDNNSQKKTVASTVEEETVDEAEKDPVQDEEAKTGAIEEVMA
jgi:hypothetical protein